MSKGKVYVTLALVASLFGVLASEQEARASNPSCSSCVKDNCLLQSLSCGNAPGCIDYLGCMGECMGKSNTPNMCAAICSQGKSAGAIQNAADVLACVAESCKGECK